MQTFLLVDPATGVGIGASRTSAPDYRPGVDEVACTPDQADAPGAWMRSGDGLVPAPARGLGAADLLRYAAERRYAAETAGITVAGVAVATDRQSQAMIAGAVAYLGASGAPSLRFKAAQGFVTLAPADLTAIAVAVGAHVQACFAAEDRLAADIAAVPPAVTTRAAIDAAFAAIAA